MNYAKWESKFTLCTLTSLCLFIRAYNVLPNADGSLHCPAIYKSHFWLFDLRQNYFMSLRLGFLIWKIVTITPTNLQGCCEN